MALVLVSTPGAANANSYTSLAEAEVYFESRPFSGKWTSASTAQKEAALVWATRLLDRSITWQGSPYTLTQSLRWPRVGAVTLDGNLYNSDVIPPELKEATAELALWLLTKDRTAETGREGIKKFAVGTLEVEFDSTTNASVIPDSAFQLIAHLGSLGTVAQSAVGIQTVKLLRT
jgi:hypothetical protein